MSRLKSLCLIASLVAIFVSAGGTVQLLRAQGTLQNSTIFGTITDTSGASISGAVVEVTSPALQGSKSASTDSSGNYRITDLPAGLYHITYTMAGFETDVRNDFTLTSGFNARVDVALKVGATSQTVEVTGQAPVIDTSTTSESATLGRPTLDAIPTSRSMTQAVYLTPGIRASSTPDVGGSVLGAQQAVGAYGWGGNVVTLIDGIDGMQANTEYGGPQGQGAGNFVDYDSVEELRVISTAADADIGPAGVVMITTMKSGGNQFHGDGHAFGEPHFFQLTNLPSTAQGGSASNQLQYFWDAFGDLGGRVIKDRLWFYGAWHLQRNSYAVFGYKGKDGGQGYNPGHQDNDEAKVTYQATKNLKFIGDFTRATKVNPQLNGSPSCAFACTDNYHLPFWNFKGEVTWTPNPKWLFDFLGGYMWQFYAYTVQAGYDVPGDPYTTNQTTGQITGADFNVTSSDGGSHDRQQYNGSVSYFPSGKHSFQFGSTDYIPQKDIRTAINHPAGNYQLVTQGTTTLTPLQLITYNYPFDTTGKSHVESVYGKDVWRVKSRLTLNYGVRFDHYRVYNSPETALAGPFSAGGTFPYQSDADWNRVTPRVGIAYDLNGSGKTVIRASYGIYNVYTTGAFNLNNYNPASLTSTTYNWKFDTCQVTPFTQCAASAAFLASLNGPGSTFNGNSIFTSTASSALGIINPDLRMPFIHTITATVERELRPNLAMRVLFVANLEEDMYDQTFPNRPISAYTTAYTGTPAGSLTYPSTDPVNGGKPITIYTYPASYATALGSKTELVNRVGDPDYYRTVEVTLTKRKTGKWAASASVDLTKNHRWIPSGSQSAAQPSAPYQLAFPLDLTWDYTFKSYFTYDLPFRVTFGLNYQILAGAPNYTTDQITGVPNLGTVTIPVNQFGSDRAPTQNVMNLRFGRIFPVKEHDTLEFTVELFNALDAAPGTSVNWLNGAAGTTKAFGFTSAYMGPMVGRLGATFKF